jgi:hypothetical protein
MRNITRTHSSIVLALTGALLASTLVPTTAAAASAETRPPALEAHSDGSVPPGSPDSRDQDSALTSTQELIAWAEWRYADAGLDLPDVELFVHESLDDCEGFAGLFRGSRDGGEIHVCADDDAPQVVLHKTLLRELGHAWALHHLSDEDITGFVALRGLEHWAEPAPWYRRGIEHAAEIMAWGLLERELRLPTIRPNDRASLEEAFRFLTGRDPIVGPPAWKDDPGTEQQPAEETGTTMADDPLLRGLVRWAASRFAEAGLDIPDADIVRHDTLEPCKGRLGYFIGRGGRDEVRLCMTADESRATMRRILLHELAHDWTADQLTGADREQFLDLRGLEHWGAPAAWSRQGWEHAAEIMAWGLMESDEPVFYVRPRDRASLEDGFRMLTGCEPLHRPRVGDTPTPAGQLAAISAAAIQTDEA